ncbi:DUF3667 domain-containing protein [Hymenobacter sp. BT175]|uniref:DUF3667 domain-containing protein n=1 Tax=Hymenobacter translucens TaxID=2886507 RepID=UPI001D0E45CD|nr:DUF3667 domain-containing protein [Hymenobacter translucens]MCC2546916.1 DUF3667 domain-containing protein [Hymenobacter translucens]
METPTLTHPPAASTTSSAAPAPEACVSCGTGLAGAYCHACGEKRLHRHDYALKHFLEHTIDTVTHFDLRVLRDLWTQLRRPGLLAAEWLLGRRVRHAPPVQLFLITNLLFYLLASVSHFSPFESGLQSQLHSLNGFNRFAQRLVEAHLTRTGTAYETFAPAFDALAHSYSKSLVFLFIPLLMVPLWLMFWRQRRYFVEWIMVSTYLFSGILLLYALMSLMAWVSTGIPPLLRFFNNDDLISPVMLVLTITYASLFFKGAFSHQPALLRWGKGLLYSVAFLLVLLVPYRFVLFMVCYWSAT